MLWHLEHGEHEETIREQCRVNKMPLPDFIQSKPNLRLGLEFYWKAFWELSTCRAVGMGEGPIPWDALHSYGLRYLITGDEFDRFVTMIKALDVEYLTYRHKVSKRNQRKGKKPIKTNHPKAIGRPVRRR